MLRRNYKVFLLALSGLFLLVYSVSLIKSSRSVTSANNGNDNDNSNGENQLPEVYVAIATPEESLALGLGPDVDIDPGLNEETAVAAVPVVIKPIKNKSNANPHVRILVDTNSQNQNEKQESRKRVTETLFREDLEPKFVGNPNNQLANFYNAVGNGNTQNNANGIAKYPYGGNNHNQQQIADGSNGGFPSQEKLKIPFKLVHIDLKGAPPKISYLKYFFKTIRAAGGNGILLEYEDMFPFKGALNGTTHKFHYKDEDIREIIASAKENDLEIIPLVQTFGHLEFVLKLGRFSHLREMNEFPQEICPSNEVAWKMVTTIIDQIMDFHKPARYSYLHIGCDEVFHIGDCTKCKGKDVKDLFIDHVIRVAKYVKNKYGVTSIIWDDMLRKFYAEELVKSAIGSHVEIMMWDYTDDVDRLLSPYLWPMYGQVFPNIWVASAYKGAFGETLYKVDIQKHAINHLSWLRVLSREKEKIRNFRGIALTGWSRYDHFSVLCELLPLAVPSLILALQILIHQDLEIASRELFKHLKCDGGSLSRLEECRWNGVELYNAIGSLQFYEDQSTSLIKSHRKDKGWLTPYNLNHNYSSPWRLMEPIQSASQYLMSLKTYEGNVESVLRKYYDEHVVTEWIEQKIGSLVQELESLINDANSLAARKSWGPRPP